VIVVAIFIIFRIHHLKNILTTNAEIFTKGFYLKHGNKEYAYAFKDIAHLQKAFFRGGNHQINSVILTLHLIFGEQVKINESGTEIMIPFADTLTRIYAQSKEQDVIKQYKKGEKI
jgi:hypothetical protein